MKRWLVKVRHYRGGTSVVRDFDKRALALLSAAAHNGRYQSENYYVEENTDYADGSGA